jgi:hypothetical protein
MTQDIFSDTMLIDTPAHQHSLEDDYEYETEYIILETGPRTTTQTLLAASASGVKLIGMDTPTPYLRIGNLTFKGKHDLNVGTDLIFRNKELVGLNERKTLFERVSLHKKAVPAEQMREE